MQAQYCSLLRPTLRVTLEAMKGQLTSQSVPINEFGRGQAQQIRLQQGFPELMRFLPALTVGTESGRTWQQATDAYVTRLSTQRLDRLFLEVHDLFSMGWNDEALFAQALATLGLDPAWAAAQSGSAWRWADALESQLDSLRTARA